MLDPVVTHRRGSKNIRVKASSPTQSHRKQYKINETSGEMNRLLANDSRLRFEISPREIGSAQTIFPSENDVLRIAKFLRDRRLRPGYFIIRTISVPHFKRIIHTMYVYWLFRNIWNTLAITKRERTKRYISAYVSYEHVSLKKLIAISLFLLQHNESSKLAQKSVNFAKNIYGAYL